MSFSDYLIAFWMVIVPPLCFLAGMMVPREKELGESEKTMMGTLDHAE